MLDFFQSAAVTIVSFLLVLGLVVTIHELGHFWAAKAMGVAVDRFSIGFGRRLASWRDKSGVEWQIAWIPLGGYVRFAGDENDASVPDGDDLEALRKRIVAREGAAALNRYFHFKPLWRRAVVVAAGPIANFVLAIALFAFLAMTLGETVLSSRVANVEPNSPAQRAGFQVGDTIVRADDRDIRTYSDLVSMVRVRAEVPIRFVVERGGREVVLNATPQWRVIDDAVAGKQRVGFLGVAPPQARADYVTVRYEPVEAVALGAQRTWRTLEITVYYLGRIVRGQVSADQIQGPIGIAQASGKLAKLGAAGAPDIGSMLLGAATNLILLAAMVSVGVGFMNLLPIPVLDGGHLLFYAYEAVARRPLAAKVQAAGYRVGLALVLGLMLFATWNDLQRLPVFKTLGGLFT
jgi:regulator of sigma E protease